MRNGRRDEEEEEEGRYGNDKSIQRTDKAVSLKRLKDVVDVVPSPPTCQNTSSPVLQRW